ncbi:MAG: type III-B CRISPR module RAMP protein Cmr1 [Treponema sp.]|nr:type III-B CRISPR module RAMP protein Cmr1 [Treponema sp.]
MNISRFYRTETIEYNLEFLTPAFLGGADQNAELRTAPFKAALRWWWRVLYGNSKTPEDLSKEERSIFGSTEQGSLARISIIGQVPPVKTNGFPKGKSIPVSSNGKDFFINILDYLAYGVCSYDKEEKQNVYNRSHLDLGKKFVFSVSLPAKSKNEITTCLNGLFTFGSIGSRSRNGFGSLYAVNGLAQATYSEPWTTASPVGYPTLNSRSKLFVTKQNYDTWEEALSEIGSAYRNARISLEKRHTFNRRGFVSRPIEHKSERIPDNIRNQRSPKQFILHVAKQKGKYSGRILSLPVAFYEKDGQGEYNKVIEDMHSYLSKTMGEKTGEILKLVEARP